MRLMYAKSVAKKKRPALIELGRRLKLLRGSMSTVTLANKLDVTDGAIRMWESGARDPGMEGILKLSAVLSVSPMAFLGEEMPLGQNESPEEMPQSIFEKAAKILEAYGMAEPKVQRDVERLLFGKELAERLSQARQSQAKPKPLGS